MANIFSKRNKKEFLPLLAKQFSSPQEWAKELGKPSGGSLRRFVQQGWHSLSSPDRSKGRQATYTQEQFSCSRHTSTQRGIELVNPTGSSNSPRGQKSTESSHHSVLPVTWRTGEGIRTREERDLCEPACYTRTVTRTFALKCLLITASMGLTVQ